MEDLFCFLSVLAFNITLVFFFGFGIGASSSSALVSKLISGKLSFLLQLAFFPVGFIVVVEEGPGEEDPALITADISVSDENS